MAASALRETARLERVELGREMRGTLRLHELRRELTRVILQDPQVKNEFGKTNLRQSWPENRKGKSVGDVCCEIGGLSEPGEENCV